MRAYLELMQKPGAWRLVLSSLPSRIAYGMSGLAVFFHAQQVTNSLATAGYAVGAYSLLSSITAAPRGHIVDRYGMTKPIAILVPAYSSSAIIMGLWADTGTKIVLCAGLMGLSSVPINMTVRPLWKDVAGPELIRTAYALDSAILSSTGLVGPVIATWMSLHLGGPSAMYAVGALMFTGGSSMLLSSISRDWKPEEKIPGEKGLWQSPAMRILALEGIIIGFGWGVFDVTIPSAATLAGLREWAAPALAAMALGGIIGGLVAGWRFATTEPGRGLVICQAIAAFLSLPLFLVQPGPWTVLVVFILSLPGGVSQVFYMEVIDIVRPRGTAVAALGTLWFLEGTAAAAGNAVAGISAENFGPATNFALASLLFVIAVAVMRYGITHVMKGDLEEAHERRLQLSN